MEQFDTLQIQCRHIEHMHEGVYNFVCTDSTEIFFSKLRSAGSIFSLTLTVRGVSNKHCLLTFFIYSVVWNSYRKTFTVDGFWNPSPKLQANSLGPLLEDAWNVEKKRCEVEQ